MINNGLSLLDTKLLIQRALLPDICTCEVSADRLMRLTLVSAKNPSCSIVIPFISLDSLTFSRSVAELIGEARYLLALETNSDMNRDSRKKRA